jgi:hypothetical protein
MKGFIGGCCSASFADTPLAEAGLDCSLLDLNIISTLKGAANGVATDTVLKESDNLVPVGLEINLLARHGCGRWRSWIEGVKTGNPRKMREGGRPICGIPPEVIRVSVWRETYSILQE